METATMKTVTPGTTTRRTFVRSALPSSATLVLIGGLMIAVTQPVWPQRGHPRVEFNGQSVDQMISSYMEANQIPGMTLSIVQAPYIPRVVGYGLADVEKGLLASPKTLWNLGQMTEAYTAVAIMQLVEAGKISIDDPLSMHIPGLPAAWQPIKLRQLLGHISGLPDYTTQPSFDFTRDYKPVELLALVRDIPLAFPPGESVTKCNTDFYLLGMVIEKASGMSYEAFVTRNQIERLGLRNTTFGSGLSSVKREDVKTPDFAHKGFLSDPAFINPTEMATGYSLADGRTVPLKPSGTGSPYRSVLASAEDVSLWDIGLAGEILVKSKANRDLIYQSIHLNDGTVVPANAGWRFPGHKGMMDIAGDVPGFSTYLSRFTAKSELVCVTLCANRGGLDLSGLARLIAGAFDPRLSPLATRRPQGDDSPGERVPGENHDGSPGVVSQIERRHDLGPSVEPRGGCKESGSGLAPDRNTDLRKPGRRDGSDVEQPEHFA